MAEQTKRIVEENNMGDKIEVINSKVEEVELEEMVDIIVSEWMGYNLLYESMLQSVLYARDKFLKKDGFMFPEKASLYIAPICDEDYIDRLKEWNNMKERYKVCMKSMIPYAQKCMARNVQITCVPQEAIQSHKCEICSLDLRSVTISDLQNIQCSFEMKCFGQSHINGVVTWFTVEFPSAIILSTSPYEESTHWAQSVFHLSQYIDVEQDSMIRGTISIQPNSISNRFLDVVLKYRKDSQKETVQNILMDDKLI
ncbi:hypothetical protein LOTGIDRAFT_198575 [Lottia gigantea]|uniref:Protein arginine N-methyltransferase 6 n=1 Tax=Lottia gigantea TaxID=225164 RepID=V4AK44_LOTGI|nr:hypothetical protein LOTGIDRAFT_198575 [Lottia gigantea]ESP04569.1 hypothetical protein LOTGIDRAFT_198575 [Lottia gigantea]